jgi:UDP-N-acetylglucosamine 2-epimerase (non-hydrolysing)
MPEETNRLLTDQIADLLLTPSRDADENLLREGVDPAKIRFVGNVMIDTVVKMLPKATNRSTLSELGLKPQEHVLVTLHRPSNVDDPAVLKEILRALVQISEKRPVLFPVHPRTRDRIKSLGLTLPNTTLRLIEPLGYLDFLAVMNSAGLVITDSGGVQEETTFLGIPCLTARPNTERPITIISGTNRLVASRYEELVKAMQESFNQPKLAACRPEFWDGCAATRIADAILDS